VPSLTIAIWPSTIALCSLTTKSRFGVPIIVDTIEIGVPLYLPVMVRKPRVDSNMKSRPAEGVGGERKEARRRALCSLPTERSLGATSPLLQPRWYVRPSGSRGKLASLKERLLGPRILGLRVAEVVAVVSGEDLERQPRLIVVHFLLPWFNGIDEMNRLETMVSISLG